MIRDFLELVKDFLMFEIRKTLDLRKIFVTPKIFLKSRFHCSTQHFTMDISSLHWQTAAQNYQQLFEIVREHFEVKTNIFLLDSTL